MRGCGRGCGRASPHWHPGPRLCHAAGGTCRIANWRTGSAVAEFLRGDYGRVGVESPQVGQLAKDEPCVIGIEIKVASPEPPGLGAQPECPLEAQALKDRGGLGEAARVEVERGP